MLEELSPNQNLREELSSMFFFRIISVSFSYKQNCSFERMHTEEQRRIGILLDNYENCDRETYYLKKLKVSIDCTFQLNRPHD